MAGGATDTWSRTFTVNFVGTHSSHTLVITAHGDGVNEPRSARPWAACRSRSR